MSYTPNELRHCAALLNAAADGAVLRNKFVKQREFTSLLGKSVNDLVVSEIKPTPVLRPWTEAEIEAECIKGTVLKSKPGYEHGVRLGAMSLNHKSINIGMSLVADIDDGAAKWLRDHFVIAATGDPCGVME